MRIVVVTLLVLTATCYAQDPDPGTIPWTPMVTGGLTSVAISVPPQYATVGLSPDAHRINIPDGWTANVYAAGPELRKLRFLTFGPDSVLYGSNMNGNNILAFPDANNDGIADEIKVVATGFTDLNNVEFWNDTMYASHKAGIERLIDGDNDGVYETRTLLFDRQKLAGQNGGHGTRSLAIDTVRRKFYVTLGSLGNADREPARAVIEEHDIDGTGRRFYATGVRNAVGLTIHPRTGRLWANNNGSDNHGNDIPGEWVDLVRDGGFYGYPFAYHHQTLFDFTYSDYKDLLPITAQDSVMLRSMRPAAAIVTAHSAPMQLRFTPTTMPSRFRNGALMVLRGSWNRTPASGSKVVFLEFDSDQDTTANAVHDFCTGFLTDSVKKERWARPVGLEIGADGSVYITSDDLKQFILKLTPPATSSVQPGGAWTTDVTVSPQPASSTALLRWPSATADVVMRVVAMSGETVMQHTVPQGLITEGLHINTASLPVGSYVIRLESGGRTLHVPMQVLR
ncbi:MAG: hypothetical protein FGM24_05800 [Candidatus Kapabacteria bacterium]|nr:hypothetical protein [Candidatus Kapabacteria bacterium]